MGENNKNNDTARRMIMVTTGFLIRLVKLGVDVLIL